MLYGTDPRPADGTVWLFQHNDSQSFMVGGGSVPAGLRALETLLHRVTAEASAAPECPSMPM
jgi:hypothetical protein